ncbi:MAG: cupin domain-containing protein [Candidatus Eremiobacteraeota bacterium]|nr:cupin domain-containing protein [Candidatus Eremiobacteraeota bacterium]
MKVFDTTGIELQHVDLPGARYVKMIYLLSENDGVPNFAMRLFSIKPGGQTPLHNHPYEHEVYILQGEGIVHINGNEYKFGEGYVIYIPPDAIHQFRQKGEQELRFLCLIPLQK